VGKVTVDMPMSLDGFIVGPNVSVELESTRVIESSGVTHIKFRVVK
jgi:hypothetical protein